MFTETGRWKDARTSACIGCLWIHVYAGLVNKHPDLNIVGKGNVMQGAETLAVPKQPSGGWTFVKDRVSSTLDKAHHERGQAASTGGPKIVLQVKNDPTSEETVSLASVATLERGCCLLEGTLISLNQDVPKWLDGAKYFPAKETHFCSDNPTYLTAHFPCDVELFLLVPRSNYSAAAPPKWLREKYVKVTSLSNPEDLEDADVHYEELEINWNSSFFSKAAIMLLGFMSASAAFRESSNNTLVVWRRRAPSEPSAAYVVKAGEKVVLGGASCSSNEMMYVVCWRELRGPSTVTPFSDDAGSQLGRNVSRELFSAVEFDDLQRVKMLVETKGADLKILGSITDVQGGLTDLMLLTSVAAEKHSMYMLCYLVERGAALDVAALDYLITNSSEIPSCRLQQILVCAMMSYVNPLSAAYAIWKALSDANADEARQRSDVAELKGNFHELTLTLLDKLHVVASLSEVERDRCNLPTLEDVLKPSVEVASIGNLDVTSIAMEAHDIQYFSCAVVSQQMEERWLGSTYCKVARADVPWSSVDQTNHDFLVKFAERIGVSGPSERWMMRIPLHLWHTYAHGARFFFESPRGRWFVAFVSLLVFMALQHYIVFEQAALEDAHWTLFGLAAYVLSMLVDKVHERFLVINKHQQELIVPLLVDYSVIALISAALLIRWLISLGVFSPSQEADLYPVIRALICSSSVPLYIMALGMIIPIRKQFGPLMYVITLMLKEVVFFLVPLLFMMIGLAIMMYGIYASMVPEFSSVPNTMLFLFRIFVGDFDFQAFDGDDVGPAYQLLGKILLVIWTVISTLALANLLIAIMTYKYKPENIEPEAAYQQAVFLEHWQRQIDAGWLGAPFSILFVLFCWAPGSSRKKVSANTLRRKFSLLPFDGSAVTDGSTFPTGKDELAYVIFLVFFYPLLVAASCGMLMLLYPLCVWHFAWHHTRRAVHNTRKISPCKLPRTASSSTQKRPDQGSAGLLSVVSMCRSGFQAMQHAIRFVLFFALMALIYPLAVLFGFTLHQGIFNWICRVAFHMYWLFVGLFTFTAKPRMKLHQVVQSTIKFYGKDADKFKSFLSRGDLELVMEAAGLSNAEEHPQPLQRATSAASGVLMHAAASLHSTRTSFDGSEVAYNKTDVDKDDRAQSHVMEISDLAEQMRRVASTQKSLARQMKQLTKDMKSVRNTIKSKGQ